MTLRVRPNQILAFVITLLAALLCARGGEADAGAMGSAQDAGVPEANGAAESPRDAGPASAADAGTFAPGGRATSSASMFEALPPVVLDPEIAPIVEGRDAVQEKAAPVPNAERPAVALKALLGLLLLLSFAYVGGHPRVQALERRIGVSQVITAGFPFVLLGLVSRLPAVGILTDELLAKLSPLLRIGLGCIGFVTGFRFSALFRTAPSADIVRAATLATVVPFVAVASSSGALLLWMSDDLTTAAFRDPVFMRDALILGTAGAMTARSGADLFRSEDGDRVLVRLFRLEELAGIVGLAIVAAYFRPKGDVTWQLPGTAWLLMTLGVGVALGGIAYVVFRGSRRGPEFVVLTLGAIAFCAGMAGYLRLSSVVVAFVAASCLALLPSEQRERIRLALGRLERPVYLLSLIVIGALWQVDDWRGWVLVPVFAVARLGGKWLSSRLAMGSADLGLRREDRHLLAISPMGPLAIAIVVNAQLLYPGGSMSPIVAAVIGGAIMTEIFVQIAGRRLGTAGDRSGRISTMDLSDPPERAP